MEIIKFGNDALNRISQPVNFPIEPGFADLVQHMKKLITENNWAGLAAPQLSKNIQLFVFQVSANRIENGEISVPVSAVINPKISWKSDEMQIDWETCLSFPKYAGEVERHCEIEYSYYDLDGVIQIGKAKGFHARVFQHEFDHLQGIIFPQRMNLKNRFRDNSSNEIIPASNVFELLGIKS